MKVVFDIETTGIPEKGIKWESDFMKFPYIVQLSWLVFDKGTYRLEDHIINNDIEIPEDVVKIHGISTEIAKEKGKAFDKVAYKFINDAINCDKVIGHNVYFDTSILKANILRSCPELSEKSIEALDKGKRIDTMMKTIKFCSIPNVGRGGMKWPSLQELYHKLFNKSFDAHNSKNDVVATHECYIELVKIGVIK